MKKAKSIVVLSWKKRSCKTDRSIQACISAYGFSFGSARPAFFPFFIFGAGGNFDAIGANEGGKGFVVGVTTTTGASVVGAEVGVAVGAAVGVNVGGREVGILFGGIVPLLLVVFCGGGGKGLVPFGGNGNVPFGGNVPLGGNKNVPFPPGGPPPPGGCPSKGDTNHKSDHKRATARSIVVMPTIE